MVNDWFRPVPVYGFEMMDAPMAQAFARVWPSIENLRRIESFEISENLRRFYLNTNTFDLSRAASQE
jgi:hypothetical protein